MARRTPGAGGFMKDRREYFAEYYQRHWAKKRLYQTLYQRGRVIAETLSGEKKIRVPISREERSRRQGEYQRKNRDVIKVARALGISRPEAREMLRKENRVMFRPQRINAS